MNNERSRILLIALSSLLLAASVNAQERKIVYENKGSLPVLGQAYQRSTRPSQVVPLSTLNGAKQGMEKFNQRRIGEEIKKLKKISRERTRMEQMSHSDRDVSSRQLVKQVRKVQQTQRIRLMGRETRFVSAPSALLPASISRASSTSASNARINGKMQDTVKLGDPFTLSFSFSPTTLSAILNVYIDADNNGIVSAGDIPLQTDILLFDNDDNDEDPGDGAYRITFGRQDLFNIFAASLIFEIDDHQSTSSAVAAIRQKPSSSIVFGSVSPARPNIACVIQGNPTELIVLTDSLGKFFFYANRQLSSPLTIYPVDFTGAANGYVPPQSPTLVTITSDTTNVILPYTLATAFIEGYVQDQAGAYVPNVRIGASGPSYATRTSTDSVGYYRLGVAPGEWLINATVVQSVEYMRPVYSGIYTFVSSNETVRKDISIVKANNTISGKVTYHAEGIGGIPIDAFTDSLFNSTLTSANGEYSIPVYTPLGGTEYYTVSPTVPNGYVVDTAWRAGILPGATNVNFVVSKVTGGLQGRITDLNTGKSVSDAFISVSGPTYKSTITNDSGYYRMTLIDGLYSLSVNAPLYYGYSDYNITISGALVTKNILLLRSGSLSGTVEDMSGKPIFNAALIVFDSTGMWQQGWGYTDQDGKYVVSNLQTAKYKLAATANGYVMQWYDKVDVADSATLLQVTEGFDTPNIDFTLSQGGSISGTVTDKRGKAISGVQVYVSDTLLNGRSYAVTNDSGYYFASGLASGSYFVQASGSSYFQQWYRGVTSPYYATKVNVTLSQNTSNINFTLLAGSSISGVVKNKSNAGIPSAFVSVLDSAFYGISFASTNESGNYAISLLEPARKYYVVASANGYGLRWYNNVSRMDSATSIILQDEEARKNIDFVLPVAGSFSGRVFDGAGRPIAYASINASESSGMYYGFGSTDELGNYIVTNLLGGKYIVEASSYGYAVQWFDHKTSSELADKIDVAEEKNTPNINFNLHQGLGISGIVTDDSTGIALPGISIEAVQKTDGSWYYGTTSADGSYSIALPLGTYIVRAIDRNQRNYLPKYFTAFGGVPLQAVAQEIVISDAQSNQIVDFHLEIRKYTYSFTQEKLGMTMTNFGRLGFWEDPALPRGRWPLASSPNYLFDGGIWVGGNKYGYLIVSGGPYETIYGEWSAAWNYTVQSDANSQKVETYFNDMDSQNGSTLGTVVRQRAYSWRNADYAIYRYTIWYQKIFAFTLPPIENAYVGFFLDFDISTNGAKDRVGIDKNNDLVFMYDSAAPNGVTMGIRLLGGSKAKLGWWNVRSDPRSDTLRYGRMVSDSSTDTPANADDYRVFVSAGPYNLNPGDSIDVAIAVVAGNGVAGIIAASQDAQSRYTTTSVHKELSEKIPTRYALYQNYPNPFNPSTTVAFDVPHASFVSLKVFNILGQEVATLANKEMNSGRYQFKWDASVFPSGVYFYRLQAGSFSETKKLVLLR